MNLRTNQPTNLKLSIPRNRTNFEWAERNSLCCLRRKECLRSNILEQITRVPAAKKWNPLQISIFDLSPIELGFKILLNVGEFETAEIMCTWELIAMHANERPRRPYARPGNELISYLLENRSANSKNKEEGLLMPGTSAFSNRFQI